MLPHLITIAGAESKIHSVALGEVASGTEIAAKEFSAGLVTAGTCILLEPSNGCNIRRPLLALLYNT